MNALKYSSIGQLDKIIKETEEIANKLEIEEMGKQFYSDTGFTRICLMLFDGQYYKTNMRLYYEKNNKLFDLIEKNRKKKA